MITEEFAALCVQRLVGLRGFPRHKDGQKELVRAMMAGESESTAERFTDDWVGSQAEAPRPTDIRTKLHEMRSRTRPQDYCESCGGAGFIGEDVLVTYRGNTFEVAKVEGLRRLTWEQAHDLKADLYPEEPPAGFKRQAILGRAVLCACRNALART